jgi:hypothetical protein
VGPGSSVERTLVYVASKTQNPRAVRTASSGPSRRSAQAACSSVASDLNAGPSPGRADAATCVTAELIARADRLTARCTVDGFADRLSVAYHALRAAGAQDGGTRVDLRNTGTHRGIGIEAATRRAGLRSLADTDSAAVGAALLRVAFVRRIIDTRARTGTGNSGNATAEWRPRRTLTPVIDCNAGARRKTSIRIGHAITIPG